MAKKIARCTLQKWGNSLAIRIPVELTRSAHLHEGSPLELTMHDQDILISAADRKKLTLDERLATFNLKNHGGEVMDVPPVGLEKF